MSSLVDATLVGVCLSRLHGLSGAILTSIVIEILISRRAYVTGKFDSEGGDLHDEVMGLTDNQVQVRHLWVPGEVTHHLAAVTGH